jgi:ribonuclease BN (tRNA processing enzyme)
LREALFPGSSSVALKFAVETVELAAGRASREAPASPSRLFPPCIRPEENPCFSLRFECDGKVVTYSGDTAWSDALAASRARIRSVHLRMQLL